MTTLETILISVLSTLGAVVLVAWLFWRWGLRKIAGVKSALGDVHAIGGYGRTPDTDPTTSSYSTLDDDDTPAPGMKRALPVVAIGTCNECSAWSLEAGQRLLDARPAFRAAGQFLSPAQMGQKRNPAFMDLEKRIFDAEKAIDRMAHPDDAAGLRAQAELHELRAELAATPEYLNVEGIEKNMKVTWQDFGLCTLHKQIRAKTDSCDRFQPTVQA